MFNKLVHEAQNLVVRLSVLYGRLDDYTQGDDRLVRRKGDKKPINLSRVWRVMLKAQARLNRRLDDYFS